MILNRKSNSKPFSETLIRVAEKQKYCDLCGEEWEGELYGKYKDYQILACNRCGLIWANPLKYHKDSKGGKKVKYF